MYAVLCINLQFLVNVLIHPGRAESLLRALKDLEREHLWGVFHALLDLQVRGLIVFVVGPSPGQVREQVKGKHPVWGGVLDRLVVSGEVCGFGI